MNVHYMTESDDHHHDEEIDLKCLTMNKDDDDDDGCIHSKEKFLNKSIPNKLFSEWKLVLDLVVQVANLLAVFFLVVWVIFSIKENHSAEPSKDVQELQQEHQQHSRYPSNPEPIMYGHVHMAKTGGTTINGKMALYYERVCGNKGYSYDFERINQRHAAGKDIEHWYHNRGTRDNLGVNAKILDEVGYEDCEYLSSERTYDFWIHAFANWSVPVELHVPCRDPVDHLMSSCNHNHQHFDCHRQRSEKDIAALVDKCLWHGRFSMDLLKVDNFAVKCFPFYRFDDYINEIMGRRLQRKRIPPANEYIQRDTNKPRNKAKECIWQDKELRAKVHKYLVENVDHYSFCDQCMGSKDDLFYHFDDDETAS